MWTDVKVNLLLAAFGGWCMGLAHTTNGPVGSEQRAGDVVSSLGLSRRLRPHTLKLMWQSLCVGNQTKSNQIELLKGAAN